MPTIGKALGNSVSGGTPTTAAKAVFKAEFATQRAEARTWLSVTAASPIMTCRGFSLQNH